MCLPVIAVFCFTDMKAQSAEIVSVDIYSSISLCTADVARS